MEDKRVSIITPCYNSEKHIDETILSVLNQTYKNWELILINDCSKDRTLQIIQDYSNKDARVKVVDLNENKGIALARNAGIDLALGSYICFLDSDDLWDKEKLATQLNFMQKNNISLTHTSYRKIDAHGNIISKSISVTNRVGYYNLLKHNEIGCLTAMYDVTVHGKRYFLDVGHEDFVYWLSILKMGYKSYGINDVLASYRVHSNTTSSNKLRAASFTWNIYRNIEGFSFIRSIYYFTHYSLKSLVKFLK